MSFMFHPYPYADPKAVNPVFPGAGVPESIVRGALNVAKTIAKLADNGKAKIGIDGYPGMQFSVLSQVLAQQLGGDARIIDARSLLKGRDEIRAKIAPCLPEDRDIDPVLLYGKRFDGEYGDLQDSGKVAALKKELSGPGIIIVIGEGALCRGLRDAYGLRMWADITPRQAALNFKYGLACNLGEKDALPYSAMMRRNYYVDFELAQDVRWSLIRDSKLDFYLSADDPKNMALIPYGKLCLLFDALRKSPFRCRPVYLEGVWGGFYLKRLRHLPDAMRNCAWIFDMIPMEVSLVADMDGKQLEVPFFTFVQQQGVKLLGKEAFYQFGGYFPIRFNYDDTFHASGNMSIQCHPHAEYVVPNHRELGRQDESYYVCVAGEGARTYLGFKEADSCERFLNAAERAQETGDTIDYQQYVHAVESKPGVQVMIPAGTIHASGQNQVILEIGSLTVGSYTYKLYDYQRTDPQTGLPRPIHLKMGRQVLRSERTAQWVNDNLVNHGGVIRAGEGFAETVVGEHDLLYFSLRTLKFEKEIKDDTKGVFHVLALTEGERVRAESLSDPARGFTFDYLDIVVVPADFGPYRIVNLGVGPVTVHKTLLKDGFQNA